MSLIPDASGINAVISQLRSEAATVEIGPGALPRTGFLISVPQYSLAGRGTWPDTEIKDWWTRVAGACTEPAAWFEKLDTIRDIGVALGIETERALLYAGTWTDRETKWFDANLYIRRDLLVAGQDGFG